MKYYGVCKEQMRTGKQTLRNPRNCFDKELRRHATRMYENMVESSLETDADVLLGSITGIVLD
jgi:hypothetical protein